MNRSDRHGNQLRKSRKKGVRRKNPTPEFEQAVKAIFAVPKVEIAETKKRPRQKKEDRS